MPCVFEDKVVGQPEMVEYLVPTRLSPKRVEYSVSSGYIAYAYLLPSKRDHPGSMDTAWETWKPDSTASSPPALHVSVHIHVLFCITWACWSVAMVKTLAFG